VRNQRRGSGARTKHSAAIVALEVGSPPYVAPLKIRALLDRHARYWGGKLGRRFTVRRYGDDICVWRLA
jgi:hypothetical protein